ncbi:MAG: hypothetical protein ACREQI_10520 [Candidatus Binataceae bacterium]
MTPAGTPVLRAVLECGPPGDRFRIAVVMTGGRADALKPRLGAGRLITVAGALGAAKRGAGQALGAPALEVIAESIEPMD